MTQDPIEVFHHWLTHARNHSAILEPTAACLATVGEVGQPSARIILIKHFDARGFVFYTNMESRKSRELAAHPKAALCVHWMPLRKQVRIEGVAERVGEAEADAYFAMRPRESRIGAWSSRQSEVLESRETLVQAVADTTRRFEGHEVTRPPFWSGWRIVPAVIEFWEEGEHRLHNRIVYTRRGDGWEISWLYP
ncbi:MAG: pyridoxamine 5'-phosphate oxidase [Pseudomonadota bacterium]|nr:pyridoxamine 5'-phosphate oxidase [Pseudomonadota bacterium]